MPPSESLVTREAFAAPTDVVFAAAIDTVRDLPGWEVVTAFPDAGEIHARSKGRLFTPTAEHLVRITVSEQGTRLELESRATRVLGSPDPHQVRLFASLLSDRVRTRLERP